MDQGPIRTERRHIAAEGQTTSDLAHRPLGAARPDAGCRPTIWMRSPCTSTAGSDASGGGDHGAGQSGHDARFCFDVLQAVCAALPFALAKCQWQHESWSVRGPSGSMVIGAETFSRLMDWTDRSTSFCSVMARAR